ncbi:mitochondrial cardiolipin hydrolase-like isoform X3 [Pecten maximus]|uniref:mitochondrial cardiolipin hydrolase-like isoform X3 n=1 Tax=Pecten maximus TaxID=6579 RepID=UPI00145886E8|nr:mitochondrial cardiolipin hydrolase-like isoform X3 [Pecten maximus]XP_033736400.1 mitochondrial cardiolipin hydrolase-like isoform X3 [Pecten maximus]
MKVHDALRFAGYTIALGAFTEIIYTIYKKIAKKSNAKKDMTEVIFFPDSKVACVDYFTKVNGCVTRECRFSHKENSLSKLFMKLSRSIKSMDVCVFVMTCTDLTDLLIQAHRRGVCVRVITDCEQVDATGSQVWRLRSEGIAVRTDGSSFFMHHKFVVIDEKTLINGSFNWTRQAITGNQENLLISDNPMLVKEYHKQFEHLWTLYDPRST